MGQEHQLTKHRRDQEQVRLQAARMFGQGARQSDVVKALGVSRSAASKWHAAWKAGGAEALAARRNPGRPSKLTPEQLQQLEQELLKGPLAHGYATQLWTLERIRRLIHSLFGLWYHEAHVWWLLQRMGCADEACFVRRAKSPPAGPSNGTKPRSSAGAKSGGPA
jgi:transposase